MDNDNNGLSITWIRGGGHAFVLQCLTDFSPLLNAITSHLFAHAGAMLHGLHFGVHSLLYFAYTCVQDLFIGGDIYLVEKIIM